MGDDFVGLLTRVKNDGKAKVASEAPLKEVDARAEELAEEGASVSLERVLQQSAYVALQSTPLLARDDPIAFVQYILEDEQTRRRVEILDFHVEWHQAINEHDRVVIVTSADMGKTQQITIGRTLHHLGRHPDTARCLLGSKTKDLAGARFVSLVMRHIEENSRVREVFPHLRRGHPWSPKEGFRIARGGSFDPVADMSVRPTGADGNIMGVRCTLGIFDDMLDVENTATEYLSDKVLRWFRKQVETRMAFLRGSGEGIAGKAVLLQNAWEDYDAGAKLVQEEGWFEVVTPIAKPETKTEEHPYGITRFPGNWPQARVDSYGKADAYRAVHCERRSDVNRRFHRSWIETCLVLGEGLSLVYSLDVLPKDCSVVVGVDLATGKRSSGRKVKHDRTCIFALLVGPPEAFGLTVERVGHGKPMLRPIWIESGRWTSPEIKERLHGFHRRFPRVKFRVEDNATQVYIVQDLEVDGSGIDVKGAYTGRNKHHPAFGVEGVAVEMSQGMWAIPCKRSEQGVLEPEPEVAAWIGEMLRYDPSAHTGDRLMASWLAREEARDLFLYEVGNAMTEHELAIAGLREGGAAGLSEGPVEDPYEAALDRARVQADRLWEELEAETGVSLGAGQEGGALDPEGYYVLDD